MQMQITNAAWEMRNQSEFSHEKLRCNRLWTFLVIYADFRTVHSTQQILQNNFPFNSKTENISYSLTWFSTLVSKSLQVLTDLRIFINALNVLAISEPANVNVNSNLFAPLAFFPNENRKCDWFSRVRIFFPKRIFWMAVNTTIHWTQWNGSSFFFSFFKIKVKLLCYVSVHIV